MVQQQKLQIKLPILKIGERFESSLVWVSPLIQQF